MNRTVDCELSVVIPAYNEETVIGKTIQAITADLAARGVTHEILVVDDGSTDQTKEQVQRLMRRMGSHLRLVQTHHQGKGAAVRSGVLAARGAFILFMDADYSTRIDEWAKCAPWLRQGFQVVIGSRKMPGAEVRRHQPPLREAMGKIFTWLTDVLLGIRVSDVTCGFKCFEAGAARHIFQLQRMTGWGFDAEILFIARHSGYRIKEVPVVWTDDATTKVHILKDAVRSLGELIQIRIGSWLGWYGHPAPPARLIETELDAHELTE